MNFTPTDLNQLAQHGLRLEDAEKQLHCFATGFPFTELVRCATPNDGLQCLDASTCRLYESRYDQVIKGLRVLKFVPASGAATRMFKLLYELLEALKNGQTHPQEEAFFEALPRFAFYSALCDRYRGTDRRQILQTLLNADGLNFSALPKALIPFHAYGAECRHALEEHLVEAALYGSQNGESFLHFTISEEHRSAYQQLLEKVLPRYESRYGIRYHIDFSIQKPSTDTLAVDLHNAPFRSNDGRLVFRPGGHGALIENVGDLDADLIFIKNIDNITTDSRRADTITYKKVLGTFLLELRAEIFACLTQLENGGSDASDLLNQAKALAIRLGLELPSTTNRETLHHLFHRPIRLCGMVRNEGEPGGGPFWTRDSQGHVSLQIVETSQINLQDDSQKQIASQATHFNPVDLVCCTKDHHGNKFDLSLFVDPLTGFISPKSIEGRELKALELPGLWNGAMAQWITLFVEVPSTVFSPVKTVLDLLRPEHQESPC